MMAYNRNNNNDKTNESIEFQIVNHIGDLTVLQSGWVKEVNIVAWNNANPKIDIREWSPDHERMSRGITLYDEEAKKLAEYLTKYYAKDKTDEAA